MIRTGCGINRYVRLNDRVRGFVKIRFSLTVLLGALGLAAALAPAYWLREHETYAPGTA
jgi:hypothetical protein